MACVELAWISTLCKVEMDERFEFQREECCRQDFVCRRHLAHVFWEKIAAMTFADPVFVSTLAGRRHAAGVSSKFPLGRGEDHRGRVVAAMHVRNGVAD